MALQASVQRRAGQVRNSGLQGIEAVIEWQQGMAAEGDDDRLFALAQNRRFGASLVEVLRLHLTTVFGLIPWRRASALMLSSLCCIARPTACVVLALP